MKYKTSIPELYALTLKAGDDLVNEDDFCKIIRSTVQSMRHKGENCKWLVNGAISLKPLHCHMVIYSTLNTVKKFVKSYQQRTTGKCSRPKLLDSCEYIAKNIHYHDNVLHHFLQCQGYTIEDYEKMGIPGQRAIKKDFIKFISLHRYPSVPPYWWRDEARTMMRTEQKECNEVVKD